jgi:hypothetical protein
MSKVTVLGFFFLMSFSGRQGGDIQFVCLKTHKATNTCHFNFTVDGAKYRYLDVGCKYSRKKDELVQKVKEGSLALAKDWKIECQVPKEKKAAEGF